VCAPAGYGKTVAVTQWLGKDTRAKAILQLDEYDNSVIGFCERFCVALLTCQPQNQTLCNAVCHNNLQSAPEELTLHAISALSCRKKAVLAIDDLHMIHNDAVLQLLYAIIKRLPPNFQIVLVSRHFLPATFSELWVRGDIAQVKPDQLLFSCKEIMTLHKKLGCTITQKQADEILEQTNGWVIGINASDYINDFFWSNIWEKWDNTTHDFMLRTAFLHELAPDICLAVTGICGSKIILNELIHKGVFITQLRESVYKYHHLFQQFLYRLAQDQGEEFVFRLLEKEGCWHLTQKDYYKALDCFIRCKNYDAIGDCSYQLAVQSNENIMEENFLQLFKHPEFLNTANKYPYLLYFAACCAFAEGRAAEMTSYIDEYYIKHPVIVAKYPDLAHTIHCVRMLDFRIPLIHTYNEINLASKKQIIAIPLLHRGLIDFSELVIGDVVENVQQMPPKIGRPHECASHIPKEALLAGLLYEQGHLTKAYEHAINANSQTYINTNWDAMLVLVNILDAFEDIDEGTALLEPITLAVEKEHNININAFIARRKFELGDANAAKSWLSINTFDVLPLWQIYAAFTTCRAYIITGKYELGIILLSRILEMSVTFNRPADIIEARILLAIAYWKKKRGFQIKALEHLEDAVSLAYIYSYVQMFINDGAELTDMLSKLQNRIAQRKGSEKKHISFIKLLCIKTCNKKTANITNDLTEKPLKFTDKQKTVMNLLCKGKSYKEISDALGIKLPSVRNHIALIYKKLGVTTMAGAVAKINEIGL